MTTTGSAHDQALGAYRTCIRWSLSAILRHGLLFAGAITLCMVADAALAGRWPDIPELLLVLLVSSVFIGVPSALTLALAATGRTVMRPWLFRSATALFLVLALSPVLVVGMQSWLTLTLVGVQIGYAMLVMPVP